jgi:hypothetical protein
MGYLVGFIVAMITTIFLSWLTDHLTFSVNQWFVGWVCCMSYFVSKDFYDTFIAKNNTYAKRN